MSLNLESMQSSRKKAPRIEEGTYMARISSIIDLGIQPMTDYKTGDPTESKARALVTWTLPTETVEVERDNGEVETMARVISKEYTLSNDDRSNLMKLITALNPSIKVLSDLLNIESMVSIGSTVNGNAKVTNVVKAPAGMPIEALAREPVFFDFDAPNREAFDAQPNWIKDKILDAENYSGFADEWVAEAEAQKAA